jgi:protease-4
MKKTVLSFVLVAAVASTLFGFNPVAVTDNALAPLVNPAGLGFSRAFEGYVISPFDTSEMRKDETQYFLRAGNIGFGAQLFGKGKNYNAFTLSLGSGMGKNFYVGTSFRWYTKIDRVSEWDIGLLYRPFNAISVGMNVRNVNGPALLKPEYDLGIGVRPFGNRFTISVDGNLHKTETCDYFEHVLWTLGAQFEPLDGIIFKGHYAEDNFGGGIGINLNHFGIEGYTNFNEDGALTDGYTVAHFSAEQYRTVFRGKKKQWVKLILKGPIVEERRKLGLFSTKHPSLKEVLDVIQKLTDDPDVTGMYLYMADPQCGFAKKLEIRKSLERFKRKGKKILCYSETMGNGDYFLASVADSIFMNPSGDLFLTGLRLEIPFIKGTLEKIGIEPELERIGKYKSAADVVSADSMSEAFKEAENAILDDIFDLFTTTIAESREMSTSRFKELIDGGPYTAKRAERVGLVDRLVYEDEVGEKFKKEKTSVVSLRKYMLIKDYVYDWQTEPRNKIAIIYATGSIVSGKSGSNFFAGDLMGSETIAKAIRAARKDKSIKAIIFRIDSGGGSGLASDVILREVRNTTEGKDKKPFIVSMSDVAGSGGYYIACAADEILADELTITGSIGVIGGKFNFVELYEKIGLKFETIDRGEHAGILSTTRPFTDEERELIAEMIVEFYQDFIEKVAEGRGLSVEEVDAIGRGRIWTGRQAKENGLIDEIGGLSEAVALAKEKAGLADEKKVGIEIYPKYAVKFFGLGDSGIPGMESHLPEELLEIVRDYGRYRVYENEHIFYIMPYTVNIK